MAQSLKYTPHPPTPQEQLETARLGSSEALAEVLHLLRELHERGVLDTLSKLTRAAPGLTGKTLEVLEGDDATRLIRNLLEIGKLGAALDPQTLGMLGRAADAGLREGARRVQAGEGVGLGELAGLLRDKDVQVALGALVGTLKGFGRALRDAGGETQETEGQRRPYQEPEHQKKTRGKTARSKDNVRP